MSSISKSQQTKFEAQPRPARDRPAPPIPPNLPRILGLSAQNPGRDPWRDKPNSQNPKTNPNPYAAKDYKEKPPQPQPKKQTQTNPIPCHRRRPPSALCLRLSLLRPLSSVPARRAKAPHFACLFPKNSQNAQSIIYRLQYRSERLPWK